jgi:hypothetical protein
MQLVAFESSDIDVTGMRKKESLNKMNGILIFDCNITSQNATFLS